MKDQEFRKIEFGNSILGPIFYDFCRKLYLYECGHKGDAVSLFAYRGGVRLRYLYERYLEGRELESFIPRHDFYISRILSMKAGVWVAYNKARSVVLREYKGVSVQQFVSGLCNGAGISVPSEVGSRLLDEKMFHEIIFGSASWAKRVQEYLTIQGEILREYLYSLAGDRKKILFVDTGWSGTTQYFLMKSFPEFRWEGIYFGKWDTWGENPSHFYCISGIAVEGSRYLLTRPQTSVFLYHHIIESPLEPRFPSIEELQKGPHGSIRPSSEIDPQKIPPQTDEFLFEGICDFFDIAKTLSIEELSRKVCSAWLCLRRKILYPTTQDVVTMTVPPRSADFGKKISVPVIYDKKREKDCTWVEKIREIPRSIWKQGKIAQDFPRLAPLLLFGYNLIIVYLRLDLQKFLKKLRIRL